MPALPALDWAAPWLTPVAPLACLGAAAAARVAGGATVAAALNAMGAAGLPRFVAQAELPAGAAYEAWIAAQGAVPTRDNAHDFFNGLCWAVHGPLKRRMNRLQAAAIARDGIGPRRGAARDRLTRFDESGALLQGATPAMWAALRAHDWPALFVGHRAGWAAARLQLVGHALLEQLALAPRRGLTAFVWDQPAWGDPRDADEAAWAGVRLLPLPVCGVPGWWPGNDAADFYEDGAVFRPPRAAAGSGGRGAGRQSP